MLQSSGYRGLFEEKLSWQSSWEHVKNQAFTGHPHLAHGANLLLQRRANPRFEQTVVLLGKAVTLQQLSQIMLQCNTDHPVFPDCAPKVRNTATEMNLTLKWTGWEIPSISRSFWSGIWTSFWSAQLGSGLVQQNHDSDWLGLVLCLPSSCAFSPLRLRHHQ